jgi:hypothetical protein
LPAVEADGEARDGAWVAELTGKLLDGWPKGMRLIVQKERPHPGAQLRITDAEGMRITCFATNTPDRPIPELELRHRLRARAEDRIQAARATGLRNFPLHGTAQNRVPLEIVQIALDLPVHNGRPARYYRPSTDPPPGPPLALDTRDHHRPRPARPPAQPG